MLIALDVIDALELAGCIVTGPALRLKTAIEFAVSADIDAAVLDVNLDGEFVTPVAEILVQRRIPFVLLTGFSAGVDLDNRLKSAPRLLKTARCGQAACDVDSFDERPDCRSHRLFIDASQFMTRLPSGLSRENAGTATSNKSPSSLVI